MKRIIISALGALFVLALNVPRGKAVKVDMDKGIQASPASRFRAAFDFGRMPLCFIANQGQQDERVAFYVVGKDKTIYFTREGMTIALTKNRNAGGDERSGGPAGDESTHVEPMGRSALERWAVKMDFVGGNPEVKPVGLEETGAIISYFKGGPGEWRTGLATYSKIVYRDLWPGIDLVYYGTSDKLKYEFIVQPGADPAAIRLACRGAEKIEVMEDGRLEIRTPLGELHDDRPVAFQERGGRKENIPLAYVLGRPVPGQAERGSGPAPLEQVYGFQVGEYDRTRPLVLDPAILVYCGYIAGTSSDLGYDIAVDGDGCAYVTGNTNSTESGFPVTTGPSLIHSGSLDVFVAKVNPTGTELVYCGYIGGAGMDGARGIAVDGNGCAYVIGDTYSDETTFPVLGGPDLVQNGDVDTFVAKVNASGTGLAYCGFIGGSSVDIGSDIAVDGGGNAYITGYTWYTGAATFPVSVGPDLTHAGSYDAFVAKVSSSGMSLSYCGYIGGYDSDYGLGIDLDSGGNAYVSGYTYSAASTFPVSGGLDDTENGGSDAFAAKVNASGTGLVYCGYIGGASDDWALDVAVDGGGNAYLTGYTYSSETTFPVLAGPGMTHSGGSDAFVAKVNASGGGLVYCGYIGGASDDQAGNIALDDFGNAYLAGVTYSDETTFPVTGGPDLTYNGGSGDAFVAKLNPGGTRLVWCGYVGGSSNDFGEGMALDKRGNLYITGYTYSSEATFPVLIGPDLTKGVSDDAWVAKISPYVLQFPVFDGHDYDGNGTSDIAVYRPANGVWYVSGQSDTQWGAPVDIPVPGNFDVDPATEIAVFRPLGGLWYISGISTLQWGTSGDIPVPRDYSGDGLTDIAVWRPSNGIWYINGVGIFQHGQDGDYPVPGDYDGNGTTDVAVWRAEDGAWYIYGGGYFQWGTAGDIPIPADYDGDGRTDRAVFRPSVGMWYIQYTGGGTAAVQWGLFGDMPVPGDYDGNGTADVAVWRPSDGLWYIYGGATTQYGQAGDVPLLR